MARLHGFVAIFFLVANAASANMPIPQDELPDALIEFASTVRNNPFILEKESNRRKEPWPEYNNVVELFSKQDDDIFRYFGFAGNFCKIQSDDPGRFCGYTNQILPRPDAGFVYVTTPIEATEGIVFLVLSSVSPESTKILAFEEGSPARLIFDSAETKNFCRMEFKSYSSYSQVRSVYYMAVIKPGLFALRESGNVPDQEGENGITLDLRNGKCSMVVEQIRHPDLSLP